MKLYLVPKNALGQDDFSAKLRDASAPPLSYIHAVHSAAGVWLTDYDMPPYREDPADSGQRRKPDSTRVSLLLPLTKEVPNHADFVFDMYLKDPMDREAIENLIAEALQEFPEALMEGDYRYKIDHDEFQEMKLDPNKWKKAA